MHQEEIYQKLILQFSDRIQNIQKNITDFVITISVDIVAKVLEKLRDDPELAFNTMMCISGVDTGETYRVVYHLYSMKNNHKVVINIELSRENPHIPTAAHLWRSAEWFEREVFDMFGIIFDGHPDLRRILCPEDWEGYPLRKDYKVQEFYHGMRVSYPGEYNAG